MRSTVVVVTYNHRRHIQRCLAALLPTVGADDEIIVVDNASHDGTPDLIATAFPSVRVVRSKRNAGFGAACNVGARLSSAEHVVFLDPDTEPRAGWLDALLRGLDDADLATAKLLLARDPTLVDTFGHNVHISGLATCRGWGQPADSYGRTEEVAAVSGACFGIRRQLFEQLGGFDERLFLYYEDDDLSLRARMAGYRCLAVPDAVVVHDHAPGFSPDKLRYLERNRLWTLLKVFHWRTLLGLLPVLLGAELLAWGMALSRGPLHLVAKLGAWLDLLAWLPMLPAERRRQARCVSDQQLLALHGAHVSFDQVADSTLARHAANVAAIGFRGGQLLALRMAAR